MTPRETMEAGQVIFRIRDGFWYALWAPSQLSDDNAIILASLAMKIAQLPGMRDAFIEFAKTAYIALVEDAVGQTPIVGTLEREEGGHA